MASVEGAMKLSTYFMAPEFERYLDSSEAVADVARVCREYGITRIYLETFREKPEPDFETVARVRDQLQSEGFEVAAAICVGVIGKRATVMLHWPCLTAQQSRDELAAMVRFTASLFDTILLDEYIWSHCTCSECQAEKGGRSWTEFRCDQMLEVCRDFVLAPARAETRM